MNNTVESTLVTIANETAILIGNVYHIKYNKFNMLCVIYFI